MNFRVLRTTQHLGNTVNRPNVNAFRLLPAMTHFVAGPCGTVAHNAKNVFFLQCKPKEAIEEPATMNRSKSFDLEKNKEIKIILSIH